MEDFLAIRPKKAEKEPDFSKESVQAEKTVKRVESTSFAAEKRIEDVRAECREQRDNADRIAEARLARADYETMLREKLEREKRVQKPSGDAAPVTKTGVTAENGTAEEAFPSGNTDALLRSIDALRKSGSTDRRMPRVYRHELSADDAFAVRITEPVPERPVYPSPCEEKQENSRADTVSAPRTLRVEVRASAEKDCPDTTAPVMPATGEEPAVRTAPAVAEEPENNAAPAAPAASSAPEPSALHPAPAAEEPPSMTAAPGEASPASAPAFAATGNHAPLYDTVPQQTLFGNVQNAPADAPAGKRTPDFRLTETAAVTPLQAAQPQGQPVFIPVGTPVPPYGTCYGYPPQGYGYPVGDPRQTLPYGYPGFAASPATAQMPCPRGNGNPQPYAGVTPENTRQTGLPGRTPDGYAETYPEVADSPIAPAPHVSCAPYADDDSRNLGGTPYPVSENVRKVSGEPLRQADRLREDLPTTESGAERGISVPSGQNIALAAPGAGLSAEDEMTLAEYERFLEENEALSAYGNENSRRKADKTSTADATGERPEETIRYPGTREALRADDRVPGDRRDTDLYGDAGSEEPEVSRNGGYYVAPFRYESGGIAPAGNNCRDVEQDLTEEELLLQYDEYQEKLESAAKSAQKKKQDEEILRTDEKEEALFSSENEFLAQEALDADADALREFDAFNRSKEKTPPKKKPEKAPSSEYLPTVVETFNKNAKAAFSDTRLVSKRDLKRYLKEHRKKESELLKKRTATGFGHAGRRTADAMLLLVDRLALDRALIVSRVECLLAIRSVGGGRAIAKYRNLLTEAIEDYNRTAEKFREVSGRSLTTLSPAIPTLVASGQGIPDLPYVTYRIDVPLDREKSFFDKKEEKRLSAKIRKLNAADGKALEREVGKLRDKKSVPGGGKDPQTEKRMQEAKSAMATDLRMLEERTAYELSLLESEEGIGRYRFALDAKKKKKDRKAIRDRITRQKRDAERAVRLERADNLRYYTARALSPDNMKTRRLKNREKIDALYGKIKALLDERDAINGELLALYPVNRQKYGTAMTKKLKTVELRAAARAERELNGLYKTMLSMTLPDEEKQEMIDLLNKILNTRVALAKNALKLRYAHFKGRVRKIALREQKKRQKICEQTERAFRRKLRAAKKREKGTKRGLTVLRILVAAIVLVGAVILVLTFRTQIAGFLAPLFSQITSAPKGAN